MFLLSFAVATTGAVLCWEEGGAGAWVPALINAVAALWAYGVSVNYSRDRENIPNFWAVVSILALILGIVFVIIGVSN